MRAGLSEFIVAGLAGFDTSAHSVGYIIAWRNPDTTVVQETAARVLKMAHVILEITEHNE